MFFCPYCGNTLLIEKATGRSTSTDSVYRWVCKTCPYVCNIKSEMHFDMKLEKKEVDDKDNLANDYDDEEHATLGARNI
ncbi:hypothetical protein C9374_011581 [Naegleria lovaniensis]|uniref:DNA-directed RNA polymerase II subunit RPB9-like zinc ribbon domain-containing protein n=1 Tax=Naegleria lovaniensis TaxID=51637 RepID=A0AA88GCE8_NAELO|nr:uncharacterized protein C9374_011581 [Naegleria lovaniensis]KAG2373916.1 hypothetical protein C9374_011581 [Naegleria lovaniensis]